MRVFRERNTRWIVDLYAWLIEIALWLFILLAAIGGYLGTVPVLIDFGWIIENEKAWSVAGAIVLAVVAFLLSAVFVGPVAILVDIRKSLRTLEKGNIGVSISNERRRPAPRNPFLDEVANVDE